MTGSQRLGTEEGVILQWMLKMDAEDLGLYTTDLASYPQADPETEGI